MSTNKRRKRTPNRVVTPIHVRLDARTHQRLVTECGRRQMADGDRWYLDRTVNALLDESEAYRALVRKHARLHRSGTDA